MQNKYIRIDCDNVGDKIELFLYQNNTLEAQKISDTIKKNINWLAVQFSEKLKGEILVIGADDILFKTSIEYYNKKTIEELKLIFFEKSGITISIGVGNNILDAMKNLKIAKISGKNKIIEE